MVTLGPKLRVKLPVPLGRTVKAVALAMAEKGMNCETSPSVSSQFYSLIRSYGAFTS